MQELVPELGLHLRLMKTDGQILRILMMEHNPVHPHAHKVRYSKRPFDPVGVKDVPHLHQDKEVIGAGDTGKDVVFLFPMDLGMEFNVFLPVGESDDVKAAVALLWVDEVYLFHILISVLVNC